MELLLHPTLVILRRRQNISKHLKVNGYLVHSICAETTPLGKSSGTVQSDIVSAVEVEFLIEKVVDEGMNSGKFLQTSHPPKTQHGPFASSKRQVGFFSCLLSDKVAHRGVGWVLSGKVETAI